MSGEEIIGILTFFGYISRSAKSHLSMTMPSVDPCEEELITKSDVLHLCLAHAKDER